MKKLLLTAALGLGIGGGAWKYQNPEGTLDDLRSQTTASVERLKVGAIAGADTLRQAGSNFLEEQQSKQDSGQASESAALSDRLAKLEEMVSRNNGNATAQSSEELTATSPKPAAESTGGSSSAELARINAIESKLDLLTRRIEEQTFDNDIAGVKEGLQVLGADVLDVQSTIEKQDTAIASDLASFNERTNALDSRLDTLASLAQQRETSADAGAQATDTVSGSALATLSASIDQRLGALEDQLQTVNADSRRLSGLDDQLLSLQNEIASLKNQNDDDDQLLSLQNEIALLKNQNDDDDQLLSLQNEIALLKKQYDDVDRSIGEISSNLNGLKTASESMSIETVQAEIRDQLATVQSQLENDRSTNNSSELETLIDTTRNRIRTLEQRVQELPASSEEADNALQSQNALEAQITALEKRLETINRSDPELASTLSDVQQQVEQLASQSFVTQEELKAQSEGRTIEYKIFFDSNSSDIEGDAAEVLKSFIALEKNRTTGVSIYGFTDRSGSAFYNQKLAEQRATNVRSYLIQNGMDYTKIKALTGLGEDAAAAVLPDNAKDSQQRVVVLYAQQP